MAEPQEPITQRLLAYVDVLGFKERVLRGDRYEAGYVLGYFAAVAAVQEAAEKGFRQEGIPLAKSFRVATFSDTIVLSCDSTNSDDIALLVDVVQGFCVDLLARGHYTRGALTAGEVFHKKASVGGKALIDAHLMEQEVAKYPRLIVDDEAVELLKTPTILQKATQLRLDDDGLWTLEILRRAPDGRSQQMHDLAVRSLEVVRRDLDGTRDPKKYPNRALALNHRAKYIWMLHYLERVLGEPIPPPPEETPADPPAS